MGIGNVGRAFLLGTSALVMTSAAAVSADFDIAADIAANQVLGPASDETGTVQAGATLSQSDTALPTVDIVGSGATLTNLGTITGIGPAASAVRATGPIVGVSVTNSGTITGLRAGFGATALADITGGVTNELGGTISGGTAGIGVFTAANISGGIVNRGTIRQTVASGFNGGIQLRNSSNIAGGVANSGTVRGTNGFRIVSNADISGGVTNQVGGRILGVGLHAIWLDIASDISGGIENFGTIAGSGRAILLDGGSTIAGPGVINRKDGVISGQFGITLQDAGSDILGGVTNEADGTISGANTGMMLSRNANISGGIDNSGLIKGTANIGIRVLSGGKLTGTVTNQADGTISGGASGIAVVSGYGTYDLSLLGGETQLTFGLHGGYQTQEAERAVVVGGTRTVGRGETQGSLMGGYLGASREFSLGEHMTLRPGARLGYLHQELEGYRDSAGLQVGALSVDSLRFGPQVELSGDYRTAGGITFKPRGQVGWSQQVALDDRAVRLTLPSGAGGKVALDDGNAGSLNVAFGLDMVFDPGTSAYLSFDGTYGSAQTRTSAFAGISFDLW